MRAFAALLTLFLVSGCAFSTGFRDGQSAGLPPETPVIVVVTEATLGSDLDAQAVFWSRSRDVLRSLAGRQGLVGHSMRLEPFGTRVWTMTVWRDDESLAAFLADPMHRRAQSDGLPALADGRFLRLRAARGQVPLAWDEAIARLARDGRGYYE